ncbi:MAG: hypothetical protein HQL64_06430 [Magnetococcales bacterium]|nr:hypothetical protein [Magnetococcales bacterium]
MVAEATTGSRADYALAIPAGAVFPLRVKTTGGIDQVTGEKPTDMESLVVDARTVTANVTPLTTIITAAALTASGGTLENISAATIASVTQTTVGRLGFGVDTGSVAFDPIATPLTTTNIASVTRSAEAVAETVRRAVGTDPAQRQAAMAIIGNNIAGGQAGGNNGQNTTQGTTLTATQILAAVTLQTAIVATEVIGNTMTLTKADGTQMAVGDVNKKLGDAVTILQPEVNSTDAMASIASLTVSTAQKSQAVTAIDSAIALVGSSSALSALKNVAQNLVAGQAGQVQGSASVASGAKDAVTSAQSDVASGKISETQIAMATAATINVNGSVSPATGTAATGSSSATTGTTANSGAASLLTGAGATTTSTEVTGSSSATTGTTANSGAASLLTGAGATTTSTEVTGSSSATTGMAANSGAASLLTGAGATTTGTTTTGSGSTTVGTTTTGSGSTTVGTATTGSGSTTASTATTGSGSTTASTATTGSGSTTASTTTTGSGSTTVGTTATGSSPTTADTTTTGTTTTGSSSATTGTTATGSSSTTASTTATGSSSTTASTTTTGSSSTTTSTASSGRAGTWDNAKWDKDRWDSANRSPVASAGTLGVNKNTAATGVLSATDVDKDTLTYAVFTDGAKGTVTITDAKTGAYSYTPTAGATGADSFTFKVNDGVADSNVAAIAVTINGPPTLAFSAPKITATSTATQATITVSLSSPSSSAVTVQYGTNDGSAVVGRDYTYTTGTLTIPAGATSGTFTVPILGGNVDKPPRSFAVTFFSPTGGDLADTKTTVNVTYDNPGGIGVWDYAKWGGGDSYGP